jgi:hypothetical protein
MSMSHEISQTRHLPIEFRCRLQSGCRWEADLTARGRIQRHGLEGFSFISVDPWELRKEFLDVPHDSKAVVEFLNRDGLETWNPGAEFWHEASFYEWQDFVRKALLLHSTKRWLRLARRSGEAGAMFTELISSIGLWCDPDDKRPLLRFAPQSPLQAILGTVLVDMLMGARFRKCGRPDCSRLFEVKWRREKFCSHRCAHTQNVREIRKAKSKRKEG